jgi:hypothetical protein
MSEPRAFHDCGSAESGSNGRRFVCRCTSSKTSSPAREPAHSYLISEWLVTAALLWLALRFAEPDGEGVLRRPEGLAAGRPCERVVTSSALTNGRAQLRQAWD